MVQFNRIVKRASIALFFFLAGCETPCPEWMLERVISDSVCFNSGRLILVPEDTCRGLEIEITRGECGTRMYINVFSLELMPEHSMQSTVVIKVASGGEEKSFNAFLYQGGQRMLLPSIAKDWIIERLCANEPVCIAVGRYKSEILPYDFENKYNALMRLEIIGT